MRRVMPTSISLLALAAGFAAPADAQSVASVLDAMMAAYDAQAQGVDNYTVVATTMGAETTTYYEKQTVDGRAVFVPQTIGMGGGGGMAINGLDVGTTDLLRMRDGLVEHGRYGGTEQVDGRRAHVITVDDLSQLDLSDITGPQGMGFTPGSGRLLVDAERSVPVLLEMGGEVDGPNGPAELRLQVRMRDYQSHGGLLVAHTTIIEASGLQALIDPASRAQLEEMDKQMANLPPEQRAMMERMMGPQLAQIRQLIQGGDTMNFDVMVSEVRVNAGKPGLQ